MTSKIMSEEIIDAAKNVPELSPNTTRLLQLTSQEDFEMQDVIDLVKYDSALTSQVLKVANSVALSGIKQISSIDRAVLYLGQRMVTTIALTQVAHQFFGRELEGYKAETGELWAHDLRTAVASREVANSVDLEINADMAFTAGLLHDFGKAVISDYLLGVSPELLDKVQGHFKGDFLEEERDLLGVDHAQVGHMVAQSWSLPGSLEMSIKHHHAPVGAPRAFQPLVYIVHVGDILAMLAGSGTGIDTLHYYLDRNYERYFILTFDEVASIMLNMNEEFDKINSLFSTG
jgi:HD-like signal output (HDOD) protein